MPDAEAPGQGPGDHGGLRPHRPPPGHAARSRRSWRTCRLTYLDPVGYQEIDAAGSTAARRQRGASSQTRSTRQIESGWRKSGIEEAQIYGRVKSIYGIYRKMYMQGKTFDEIYDVYARADHRGHGRTSATTSWASSTTCSSPIPNRFKDYISTPKPNMYQSLHTTVIGQGGHPL